MSKKVEDFEGYWIGLVIVLVIVMVGIYFVDQNKIRKLEEQLNSREITACEMSKDKSIEIAVLLNSSRITELERRMHVVKVMMQSITKDKKAEQDIRTINEGLKLLEEK